MASGGEQPTPGMECIAYTYTHYFFSFSQATGLITLQMAAGDPRWPDLRYSGKSETLSEPRIPELANGAAVAYVFPRFGRAQQYVVVEKSALTPPGRLGASQAYLVTRHFRAPLVNDVERMECRGSLFD